MTGFARIALVSLLAAALVACGGAEDRKAKHQTRGDQLFAEGNYEKARVEYKNVLQIDPKDVPARIGLAKTFEKLEQWREAAGHYKAAVDQDATNVESRIQLGRIMVLAGALDEADKLVGEVLALDAQNAEALALRGTVKARRGDTDGALADGEASLKVAPANVQALSLLASIKAGKGDAAGAVEYLERALQADPKNTGLRAALAGLYIQRGDNDRAVAVFKEIATIEPDKLAHQVRLAALYTGLKRPDDAERVLREAVNGFPEDPQARLALVEFLVTQRSREVGERELRGFIDKDPDSYPLRFALARLLEATADLDGAKQVYRDVIGRAGTDPQGLEARTKLARALAQQSQLDEAGRLVEEVLKENAKDEEALVLRGNLALARNKPVDAINDYRSALKGRPSSAELLLRLAKAHELNQEPQLAEENLRKAVDAEPGNLQARLQLAQTLAQGGKVDAALEQIDAGLKAAPGNAGLLEVKARLLLAAQRWEPAAETAKLVEKALPDKPIGYFLTGMAVQGKGNGEASLAAFERAAELAPKAPEPLTAIVQVMLKANQLDRALERLNKAIEAQPDNAVAWNLKGEVLLVQKQSAEAEVAFAKATELSPESVIPYRNRALAEMSLGKPEAALETFKRGVQATGGQAMLRFQLATLYEQLGRYEDAIGEHEAMLKQSPDSLAVVNNLAMLLVSYRTDAASLARASELAARLEGSENAAFLDTLGWVQFKRGEIEPAYANLKKAVDRSPEAAVMHYHLGKVYEAKGDPAKAKEYLERAVTAGQTFQGLDDARSSLEKLKQ